MPRSASSGFVPPADDKNKLRAALRDGLDPATLDGIISMHLIESDPALSQPITAGPSAANPGAGDWFVLIDGTDVNAVAAVIAEHFTEQPAFKPVVVSTGDLQSDVGSREERHSRVKTSSETFMLQRRI